MNPEPQVEILLPQLWLAEALQAGAPALQGLLRQARLTQRQDGDEAAWLCRRFGVERQQDWPLAPFAAAADGLAAEQGYWLRADPVHLRLLRDSLSVTLASTLTAAEAEQLVGALNAHFAEDGLRFHAPHPGRWYLQLAQSPELRTAPLAEALGRDVQPLLPQGGEAMRWHAWINEMQMLLHGHPLSQLLEEQGRLPVNSLWLWGGGRLSGAGAQQPLQIWAEDAAARGLALAHGGRAAGWPATAAAWLPQAAGGQHLLLPIAQPDWRQFEADWLAPLLTALRAGALRELTLHLAHAGRLHSYLLRRADLRRFWRRAQPLGAYLD